MIVSQFLWLVAICFGVCTVDLVLRLLSARVVLYRPYGLPPRIALLSFLLVGIVTTYTCVWAIMQLRSLPATTLASSVSSQTTAQGVFFGILLVLALCALIQDGRRARIGHALRPADRLMLAERFPEARAVLEGLAARYPKQPAIWAMLGVTLAQLDQTQEALAACAQALALRPHLTLALQAQAYTLALGHLEADVLPYCEQILARAPRHAPAWTYQAYALERLGKPDAALLACERALRPNAQPSGRVLHGLALTVRAYALSALGRYEEALGATQDALAAYQPDQPASPRPLRARLAEVIALLGLQRTEEGHQLAEQTLPEVEQALAVRPANADLWEIKVALLTRLGREAEAQRTEAQADALHLIVRRR
jgi:tetratricopeptide (TPR) repeat protein